MNGHITDHRVPVCKRLNRDAFTLNVRQGPERGRVAGAKDKDRKPVDPPPIIQLQIKDPLDPAQNYLQSPYLFMCASLCDADLENTESLAADKVLCGTLVSSLHRLKDIDNSDGGFFVFGDMSVKVEGQFRLRFILFEMNNKRPASSLRSDQFSGSFEDSTSPAQRDMAKQECGRTPIGAGSYASQYTSLSEPTVKRQRTSVDMSNRPVFDTDRLSQRSLLDQRTTYNSYTPASQLTNGFAQTYSQGSQSALSSVSDYSYGHQKTSSSSTSSPFISPHTDGSGQSWSTQNLYYTSPKDPLYPYAQGQYAQGQYPQGQYSQSQHSQDQHSQDQHSQDQHSQDQHSQGQYSQAPYSQAPYLEMQPPRAPQSSDALVVRQRGPELSNRTQMNTNFTFPRGQDPESSSAGSYSQLVRPLSTSSNYNDHSARLPSTDQISDLAASSRPQYPATTMSNNILPPIDLSMGSGQHRAPSQMLSNNIISSMEPHTMVANQSVHEREHESYDPNAYSLPLPNQKEFDEG
ncbi:MAG: hypothetical protein Q9212_004862 [Teloschistes hypoglaucus]